MTYEFFVIFCKSQFFHSQKYSSDSQIFSIKCVLSFNIIKSFFDSGACIVIWSERCSMIDLTLASTLDVSRLWVMNASAMKRIVRSQDVLEFPRLDIGFQSWLPLELIYSDLHGLEWCRRRFIPLAQHTLRFLRHASIHCVRRSWYMRNLEWRLHHFAFVELFLSCCQVDSEGQYAPYRDAHKCVR